jgi:myosin heavy subunit
LVAVNPFERLDIYGKDSIRAAESNSNAASVPFPHVFVTGALAYLQMKAHSKDQSVLISGESGAGKTETTKKVLTYLASVAPDTSASSDTASVETKILQSNPLLEALGNAKVLFDAVSILILPPSHLFSCPGGHIIPLKRMLGAFAQGPGDF